MYPRFYGGVKSVQRPIPAPVIDTHSDARRPPAFCTGDLFLRSPPTGAWSWCSSLRACASNGALHPRAKPGQAPRWGVIAKAYGRRSPEGVDGTGAAASHARRKERDAVQLSGRIPKGALPLGRTFGDFSCVRKVTPAERRSRRPQAAKLPGAWDISPMYKF